MRKAQRGEIKHFTGIDSAYEGPEDAELTLKTVDRDPSDLAAEVVAFLRSRGYVP